MKPVTALVIVGASVLALGCGRLASGATTDSSGADFLAKNAKAPGIQRTASGLEYRILRSGPAAGAHPKLGDEVKVNYEGKLLDGQVFDSSYERGAPAVMTLRGLVPGWIEALQLMRPGDDWLIYLPPSLGYGAAGAGPIPPNAVIVFRIELLGDLPAPSPGARG